MSGIRPCWCAVLVAGVERERVSFTGRDWRRRARDCEALIEFLLARGGEVEFIFEFAAEDFFDPPKVVDFVMIEETAAGGRGGEA